MFTRRTTASSQPGATWLRIIFVNDHDHAIYRYNHAGDYVRAVNQYAALIGGDPAAFAGYYRWDVYCRTTTGDVLLPIGYVATSPIPVADYVATHPQ
jgi:hypothetical protein